MPTKREREYFALGYRDGFRDGQQTELISGAVVPPSSAVYETKPFQAIRGRLIKSPRKRKLSAWNKFVKANSKKPRFRYRNGKLNLKKMAIAFRKTPAGKKKRR